VKDRNKIMNTQSRQSAVHYVGSPNAAPKCGRYRRSMVQCTSSPVFVTCRWCLKVMPREAGETMRSGIDS